MKIKEIEELTGIPRANIRFYEKEGMLCPHRSENGYRDYSEEDKEGLLKIKLLRSLDISLEDIKSLQQGNGDLSEVLDHQLGILEEKKIDIDLSRHVCMQMREDNAQFHNLDAQKYINSYNQFPIAVKKEDTIPRVKSPIRRYIARRIDLSIYAALAGLLLTACNVNIFHGSIAINILRDLLLLCAVFFAEPLLLKHFGTTPGKWITGLYVYDEYGRKLSYADALSRTEKVLVYGMGLRIPVYSLVRLWKSYLQCSDETNDDPLAWEKETELVQKEVSVFKSIVGVVCTSVFITGIFVGSFALGQMPKNRGEISIAEFAENYNRSITYYYDAYQQKLNENGQWINKSKDDEFPGGVIVIDICEDALPDLEYKVDEKGLYEIRVCYVSTSMQPRDLRKQMQMIVNSFACTEKTYSVFSENRKSLINLAGNSVFDSYHYDEGGIAADCEVFYSGFSGFSIEQGTFWPDQDVEPQYSLTFTITKNR